MMNMSACRVIIKVFIKKNLYPAGGAVVGTWIKGFLFTKNSDLLLICQDIACIVHHIVHRILVVISRYVSYHGVGVLRHIYSICFFFLFKEFMNFLSSLHMLL